MPRVRSALAGWVKWTAGLTLAIGCTSDAPTAPVVQPSTALARIDCVADVRSMNVACAAPGGGASQARIPVPGSANADIIVGGQNVYVTLTSSNVTYSGDVFSFNTTITNLIEQKMGTTDGTTADPNGIRIFFSTLPTATSGTGTPDFVNPADASSLVDGYATFTQSNQPYYQYSNTILSQNQTSAQKLWRIHVPASVLSFSFVVYVSAPVQYPDGYVTVTPASKTLQPGQTQQLTATVKTAVGATAGDQTVTWGSSATGVATVNSSGLVTAVADGSATITATGGTRTGTSLITVSSSTVSAANTTISGANFNAGSTTTVTVQAKDGAGANVTAGGATVVLSTDLGSLTAVTDNANGTYTATLSSSASGTAHVTGTINGGTIGNPATITVSSTGLLANPDTYPQTVIGNVGISSGSIPYSALTNDNLDAGVTVTFFGNGGVSGTTQHGGTVSMVTSGANRGQFTYEPPVGYTGADQFTYTISGGSSTSTSTVSLTVANMVWFINNNAGACSSSCDGRLSHPFTSIASFMAVNDATGTHPSTGQNIFVYESATSYTGPLVLLNNQRLVGQDASASLASITGITPPSGSTAFPAMNTGGNAVTIAGASGGVQLNSAASGSIYGLTIATTGGTALGSAASFGTLTFTSGTADVSINSSGGPAISLSSGALAGTMASVTASGGTNVLNFGTVTGSLTINSGAITGGASSVPLNVNQGSASLTLGVSLTQSGAGSVASLSARTGGTVTVSGNVSCTSSCTGLAVANNTGGSAVFSGATKTLTTGTANAITFTGNSAPASLQFSNGGLAVTTSTGKGLNFTGAGTVTVAGTGNTFNATGTAGTPLFGSSFGTLVVDGTALTASGGPALDLTTGAVTIGQTSTVTASSASSSTKGINLSAVTGSAQIGPVGVNGVTGSTGTGIDVSGGSASLTLSMPVTKTSSGLLVNVSGHATGNVTLSGALSCTTSCTGLSVGSNTSGTIAFSNASKTFTTGTATAVSLSSNTGAVVTFSGGGLVINTSTGNGFDVSGGGTVNVTGTGNTVTTSGSGSGVKIVSTTIGSSNVTFQSVSTGNGATTGVLVDATGATGRFIVTGTGGVCRRDTPTCAGGTINGTGGADGAVASGIFLRSTLNPSLQEMRVTGTHNNFGIYGNAVAGLTLDKMLLDGTYGTVQASLAADSVAYEGAAVFDELSGQAVLSNSYFANGNWSNVRVHNAAGGTSLDSLLLSADTIGKTIDAAGRGGSGLEIWVDAGTTKVHVKNSAFRGAHEFGALFNLRGGTNKVSMVSNVMDNTMTNAVASAYNHIRVFPSGTSGTTGSLTYVIRGNNVQRSVSNAIHVEKNAGNWTITGDSISGNTVGTIGSANSGSTQGDGIAVWHRGLGLHTVAITGNTVYQFNSAGIRVLTALSGSGEASSGQLHVAVKSNTVSTPGNTGTGFKDAFNLGLDGGAGRTYTVCINLGNGGSNDVSNGFTGSSSPPGAPYSIGDLPNTSATGAYLKVLGLAGGPYVGNAANSAIQARWDADNVHGSGVYYGEFSTGGMNVVSSTSGSGASCQIP